MIGYICVHIWEGRGMSDVSMAFGNWGLKDVIKYALGVHIKSGVISLQVVDPEL
jgi:hypothetical protein